MTCFVDTSALLAVMDKDDAVHKEAKALWKQITEQRATLVTTNYVVLETVALLQHRIGSVRRAVEHDQMARLRSDPAASASRRPPPPRSRGSSRSLTASPNMA
jgi:predicted nucleic acid-binding protein